VGGGGARGTSIFVPAQWHLWRETTLPFCTHTGLAKKCNYFSAHRVGNGKIVVRYLRRFSKTPGLITDLKHFCSGFKLLGKTTNRSSDLPNGRIAEW